MPTYQPTAPGNTRVQFNDDDALITRAAINFADWAEIVAARRAQAESNYANETTQIETTRDINLAIARQRDLQAPVFIHTATDQLIGNPDRAAISRAHPHTDREAPDPSGPYAAEALWNQHRRTLREGGPAAATLLHALADGYRRTMSDRASSDPTMDIDADLDPTADPLLNFLRAKDRGDTQTTHDHTPAEATLPDNAVGRDVIAVVSATREEAAVVGHIMRFADQLEQSLSGQVANLMDLPESIRAAKMSERWPAPEIVDAAFYRFRPLHPAILNEKETVAVIGYTTPRDIGRILEQMATESRPIVTNHAKLHEKIDDHRWSSLDSGTTSLIPAPNHENTFIAQCRQNETIMANSHRLVAIWNGNPRDLTLQAISTAASLGKPFDVFSPEGVSYDPDKMLRLSREQFPTAGGRVRNEWDTKFAKLGALNSTPAQLYLSLRTSPRLAAQLAKSDLTTRDLLAASTDHRVAATIAAKIGTTPKYIAELVPPNDPSRAMLQRHLRRVELMTSAAQEAGVTILTPASPHFPKAAEGAVTLLYAKGNLALLNGSRPGTTVIDESNAAPTAGFAKLPHLAAARRIDIETLTPTNLSPAAVTISPYPLDVVPAATRAAQDHQISRGGVIISATPLKGPEAREMDPVQAKDTGAALNLAAHMAGSAIVLNAGTKGPTPQLVSTMLQAEKPVALMAPSTHSPEVPKSPLGAALARQVHEIDKMAEAIQQRGAHATILQNTANPDSETIDFSRRQRADNRNTDTALARLNPADFAAQQALRRNLTIVFQRADAPLHLAAFLERTSPQPTHSLAR